MATDARTPSYTLPALGDNPSSRETGTTPGSFANPARVGTPFAFSSPDTPGMPAPSDKTAWDFMPEDWRREGDRWVAPDGFEPVTQLEHARLGIDHRRDAPRRRARAAPDALAGPRRGGRRAHGDPREPRPPAVTGLDPMAIGRASLTKINANMGASPVSSDTDEEVEKLRWAERWGRHGHGPLDRRRPRRDPRGDHPELDVPIGTVPIYSMILGRQASRTWTSRRVLETVTRAPGVARGWTTSRSTPACCAPTCRSCATV